METETLKSDIFVLVPSYNHARYVETCLRSIIGQTVKPSKLLVIDDGSSDGSPDIIEKALRDCPFDAELIARQNIGLCATLNQGLESTSCDYFAYLGSDDLWLPDFLSARQALLDARREAVLAYGNAYLIDDSDNITESSEEYRDDWAFFPDGNPMPMLTFGTSPISSTVVYRRESLKDLRWNKDARLEDYEMYLNLSTKGEFAFDPKPLSAWRRHTSNTSRDVTMMLSEILGAQTRAFESGVLTQEQTEIAQRRTRFRFARELLQNGLKSDAFKLARGNFGGARSFIEKVAFSLRMLVPTGIVEHRRTLRAKRASRKIQEML